MTFLNSSLMAAASMLLLALASPGANAAQGDGMTLGQSRERYLNQRILILQDIPSPFGDWAPVQQARHGSFKNDYHKGAFLDPHYKDQTVLARRPSRATGDTQTT